MVVIFFMVETFKFFYKYMQNNIAMLILVLLKHY